MPLYSTGSKCTGKDDAGSPLVLEHTGRCVHDEGTQKTYMGLIVRPRHLLRREMRDDVCAKVICGTRGPQQVRWGHGMPLTNVYY